ncbi:MAG: TetR/AcrR family transcriptional regulator [Chitinophagales bacterium]|nr:TetR/AcrR family transcriptional regulator [Chitinophagales bacterium]
MNDTRERILKASQELFFSYGIRSITMDDVARHLAISKKTIYHFFSDKDQIVLTLCRLDCEFNAGMMDHIARNSKDAIDEILQAMEFMSALFKRMNPNLIYDMQKYHHIAWNEFKKFREQNMMGTVERNLRKGIKQGLYRTDINTKLLARLRIEEVEMGMNPNIFPPGEYDLRKVQVELLSHFIYGILTEKGIKELANYKASKKNKKSKAQAA